MNQTNIEAIKCRKSTPQTRPGQYMCPECGKIFETKKEVDAHKGNEHKAKPEETTDEFFVH